MVELEPAAIVFTTDEEPLGVDDGMNATALVTEEMSELTEAGADAELYARLPPPERSRFSRYCKSDLLQSPA